jgi:hypothetical protein
MAWRRDGRVGARKTTCAALTAALAAPALLGACAAGSGSGATTDSSPAPGPVGSSVVAAAGPVEDRFGDGVVDEDSVRLVTDSLALAGVRIVRAETDEVPAEPSDPAAGPLAIGDAQARAFGVQADLGGGLSGRELREALALGAGAVPVDVLVAAWLAEGMTPAAQAAAALVPVAQLEDPASFVFPWAVLLMFVNDVGRSSGSWPPAERAVDTPAPPGASSCERSAARVEASLGDLVAAMGSGPDALDRLLDVAVPAFGHFLPTDSPPSPDGDRAAVVAAVTALGFAALLAGTVEPWAVAVLADPPVNALGEPDGPGRPGGFEAVVVPVGPMWSPEAGSCAVDTAERLPPLDPRDAPVTWSFQDAGVAEVDRQTTALASDGDRFTAALRYLTRASTSTDADDAAPAMISATLRVHHSPAEPLLVVTERLAADALEGAPAAVLDALTSPPGDPLSGLIALTSARAASPPVSVARSGADG